MCVNKTVKINRFFVFIMMKSVVAKMLVASVVVLFRKSYWCSRENILDLQRICKFHGLMFEKNY